MTFRRFGAVLIAAWIAVLFGCSEQASEVPPVTTAESPPAAAAETPGASEPASEQAVVDTMPAARPNIVLILADDLGYSDIGAFGGEINTPNLDALAGAGMMLTNFHVAPTCSPTRAMLLSGADNHKAGLGTMNGMQSPEQKGQPGYEAYLNYDVVTFVQLLRDADYHTYMSGKWQLGYEEGLFPPDRGFEEAYWLMHGGASHFADMKGLVSDAPKALYFENRVPIETLPEDFYSSKNYTDKMIEYIDKNRADDEPFFLYAAYTAPHWPLHAPDDYIAKYEGVYDVGYVVIRAQRIKRMRELGLIGADQVPAPQHPEWPSWDSLNAEQQALEVRRMQVYAGMVEALDHHIGRLVAHLRETGEMDNTIIMFMSDNGAEGANPADLSDNESWLQTDFDNSRGNMGRPDSYISYGPGWAHVGATPFSLYKSFPSEGGLISPSFVVFPGQVEAGTRSAAFATVLDVAPTLLELAGVDHPAPHYKERAAHAMEGTSMLDLLQEAQSAVHGPDYVFGLELFNRRVLHQGDWKLLYLNKPWGKDDWAMYNLADDPAEQHDLSGSNAEKYGEMLALWEGYVERNNVVVFEGLEMRFSNGKTHYDLPAEPSR